MSPEAQRYRLFEAVTAMLSTASRRVAILIVFDDLHWADKTTLLLLRHVMRSAGAARFAIVATYRESELDRSHPLAGMLGTLRGEHNVTRDVVARSRRRDHRRAGRRNRRSATRHRNWHDSLPRAPRAIRSLRPRCCGT